MTTVERGEFRESDSGRRERRGPAQADLSNAWDNPDWWGRQHKRLAKAAEGHLAKSLARGDASSSDAWSQVFSRHSKEAVKLMEFKRRMLLDVGISRSALLES